MALTKGCAWKIEFKSFHVLFHKIEGLKEWGRAWMSSQLFIAKQHSIDIRTKSATERYLILVNDKPEIIQQAPL